MIARYIQEQIRIVTQPDHARLAMEILRLWKEPELVENPRRDEILSATLRHDNGWQESDSAPRVDPRSGRPYGFRDLPVELRLEIWRRSSQRVPAAESHAGRLILRHSLELLGMTSTSDPVAVLRADFEDELENALGERGDDRETLEADYGWLRLADRISLILCEGVEGSHELDGVRAELKGAELELDPFPLAGSTRFRVASRTIPDRRYRDDTDLAMELVTARWSETEFRLIAPSSRPS